MKNTSNLKQVDSLLFHFIFSFHQHLLLTLAILSSFIRHLNQVRPIQPKQDWLLLALCVYRMPCLTSWWGPSNLKSCIRIRNTKRFLAAFVFCVNLRRPQIQGPENPGRLRVKRLGSQFCDSYLNFLPLCGDTLRAALWWSVTCHGEGRLRNAKAAAAAISWRGCLIVSIRWTAALGGKTTALTVHCSLDPSLAISNQGRVDSHGSFPAKKATQSA